MRDDYTILAGVYDRLMRDVDYTGWSERIIALIEGSFGKNTDLRIADCACGTFSVSIPLYLHGYDVTGIDLSEDMLQIARNKCRAEGCRIPLVRADIRSFALHRPADVINCSCDGLNYLTSIQSVRDFFKSAHEALCAGGLLLFDVSTSYKLEKILADSYFGESREDLVYLWQNSYDPPSRVLQMDLDFFLSTGEGLYTRHRETHFQRAHTDEELRAALTAEGFELLSVTDGYTEYPLRDQSERAHYYCRRI